MTKMRIAVAGSSGRMGRALLEAVLQSTDLQLSAALEISGNASVGKDAGELVGSPCGVAVSVDIEKALAGSDVLIDFTRPEGTAEHVAACRRLGVKLVIGTTGFSDAQKKEIAAAAQDVSIVMAPNMSVGTNLVFKLSEMAARVLNEGYDVEIIEAHHRHKVDAPSGTALHIGNIIAGALGRNLDDCAIYGREGVTGERKASTIGFATVRGGDIVGDHKVMFSKNFETIELSHRAYDRSVFASGALRATRWVIGKKPGIYGMSDVLDL